jgi:small subunit ribosomal protein S2
MPEVGIRELLEAGVHFGHQTRRWNPKMRRFIHGERGGIYIIDLLQTQRLLEQARQFAGELAQRGGVVLFVGTKKQARDAVKDVAEAAGMPYVNHRWLGGLLTNFQTINQRIRRLHDLERYETEGQLGLLPTRERMAAEADLAKLRANLGGVKYMQRTPDAMFVIDLKTELIAVREAQRLRIPIIGLVDTNCDPDGIDFVIPATTTRSSRAPSWPTRSARPPATGAWPSPPSAPRRRSAFAARPRSARAARPRSRPAATPRPRRPRPPRRRRPRPSAPPRRPPRPRRASSGAAASPLRPPRPSPLRAAAAEPAAAPAAAAALRREPAAAGRARCGACGGRARAARCGARRRAAAPAAASPRGRPSPLRLRRPGPLRPPALRRSPRRPALPGPAPRCGPGASRCGAGGRARCGPARAAPALRGRARPPPRRARPRRRAGAEPSPLRERDPGTERMSTTPQISAKDVAALRQQTGAGMMDCKRALEEADGDAEKAVEILRVKMGNKLGKLADREAAEGTIQSYIHANGKVGVLVEVDCNTDFVAKNDDFIAFARDVALHLAASPQTRFVSEEEVPEDVRAAEARVFEQQAADKPENVRPRIVEGQIKKWLGDVVLLNQVHVNADKYEGKTIEQLRGDLSAKTGENVVIRRFARFAVGE